MLHLPEILGFAAMLVPLVLIIVVLLQMASRLINAKKALKASQLTVTSKKKASAAETEKKKFSLLPEKPYMID